MSWHHDVNNKEESPIDLNITAMHLILFLPFQNGTGDTNDVWKVMIVDGKEDEFVTTVSSKLKFIHYLEHCVLTSSGKQLPKWWVLARYVRMVKHYIFQLNIYHALRQTVSVCFWDIGFNHTRLPILLRDLYTDWRQVLCSNGKWHIGHMALDCQDIVHLWYDVFQGIWTAGGVLQSQHERQECPLECRR